MPQTEARPYMSISVQLDTPNPPLVEASLEMDRDRIAAMCDAIDAEVYHPEHSGSGVWR